MVQPLNDMENKSLIWKDVKSGLKKKHDMSGFFGKIVSLQIIQLKNTFFNGL